MNRLPTISGKPVQLSLALVSLALLPGCGIPWMVATETRNTSVSVTGSPIVEIEARNGSIEVVCQPDLNEARIEATITCRAESQELADERLSMAKLVVDDSDDTLKIYTKFPEPLSSGDGVSILLRIPSMESANLRTSNGSVDVDGRLSAIQGVVKVETSNGKVQVNSAQSVDAESSNGSMNFEKIAGNLTANSSNASVTLSDVAGLVDVETSNGKIIASLSQGQHGPVQARTSNGRIELNVAADFSGQVAVSTSNAKVKLHDPDNRINESTVADNSGVLTIGQADGHTDTSSRLSTSNGAIEVSIGSKL